MRCQSVIRVEPYEGLHQDIKQAFRLGSGDYDMSVAWRQGVPSRTASFVYNLQTSTQMEFSFRVLACENFICEEKQACHEYHKHISIRTVVLEIIDVLAHQAQRLVVLLQGKLFLRGILRVANHAM